MVNNIASVRKEIEDLTSKRENIYNEQIRCIDQKIQQLRSWIAKNCQHHFDLLLIEEHNYDDEYGKFMDSWTKYHIVCSVCGASRWANKDSLLRSGKQFSDVLTMDEKELKELNQ